MKVLQSWWGSPFWSHRGVIVPRVAGGGEAGGRAATKRIVRSLEAGQREVPDEELLHDLCAQQDLQTGVPSLKGPTNHFGYPPPPPINVEPDVRGVLEDLFF